ncbi:MAG: metallophosphoesterase, partial [Balneolaceae bacterium]
MPWPLRMVSYAATILLVLFLYFGFRYYRSLKLVQPQSTRFYFSFYFIAAILFFTYPVGGLIQYWITNSFERNDGPVLFIYLFWYGLIFAGTMLNWLLLHDLLLPIAKRFSRKPQLEIGRHFARFFLSLIIITLAYTAGKLIWDTHRITSVSIDYVIPETDLMTTFSPLTIVHVADLHADQYTNDAKMDRYVKKINETNPDLVLFGGDLITSGSEYVDNGADALAKIESTYGTFAVLGDHDYWNDPDFITEVLETKGVTVLDNENFWFDHHGSKIKISGITEIYSTRITNDSLNILLEESDQESLKILFSHQASDRLIDQSLKKDMHLLFGAHTHGGQIRIPFFFYPATAVREETQYVNGHWMLENLLLNVNSGLGFTLSPVRYNAPAQVTVVKVRRET